MAGVVRVSEINHRIRDLINEPRLNRLVRQNRRSFNQLVSALDLVDDSQLAIDAYARLDNDTDLGTRYLCLYGVWQAFQLQQSAVRALGAALGIPQNAAWWKRGGATRKMRTDVAGHPVDRSEDGRRLSHQVSQISLSIRSFDLLRAGDDGTIEFESVSVPAYIQEQAALIEEELGRLERELRSQNAAHRQEFRDVKFKQLLDKLDYPLEKVMLGGSDPGGPTFVVGNVRVLRRAIGAFEAELARRNIDGDAYIGVEHALSELNYVLEHLEQYFGGSVAGDIANDREAHVFAFYARALIRDLYSMARELDDEYERGE